MWAFLVRRIVFGIVVLIGTSIITFAIAFVIPADPAVTMAGSASSAVAGNRPAIRCATLSRRT